MKKITELRQAIKNGYNLYFNGHIIENINVDSLQLSGMVRVKFADSDELIWVDINEIKVSSLTQFKAIYTKKFTAEPEDAIYIAKLHKPQNTELENVVESKDFDLFETLAAATKPQNNE